MIIGRLVSSSAGSGVTGTGDVAGPSSGTDNAIARFDGTDGKTIQNSKSLIGDDGTVTLNNSAGEQVFQFRCDTEPSWYVKSRDDADFYTRFQATASDGRTISFPDSDGTVALIGLAQTWTANQTLSNVNIILGTTTGTKIGTATTQKLGFWNATPIVQPASANQAAFSGSTAFAGGDTVDLAVLESSISAIVTLLNELRQNLVDIGAIKGSA